MTPDASVVYFIDGLAVRLILPGRAAIVMLPLRVNRILKEGRDEGAGT